MSMLLKIACISKNSSEKEMRHQAPSKIKRVGTKFFRLQKNSKLITSKHLLFFRYLGILKNHGIDLKL